MSIDRKALFGLIDPRAGEGWSGEGLRPNLKLIRGSRTWIRSVDAAFAVAFACHVIQHYLRSRELPVGVCRVDYRHSLVRLIVA